MMTRSRRRLLVTTLPVLSLLTFAAFWPLHRNGFVGADDETYITGNTVVLRGITTQGVALAFTRSHAANWHPLTWISHMLDVELFGLDPRGHHFVGLALHTASSMILFLLLSAMTGRSGPSFVVAALFAVHPLRVESVAWAAERKDVLCGLFWMLTTAAYLRYTRRPGLRRFFPAVLLFACGLMSKPMMVTLPFVLLILDWWPLGRAVPLRRHLPALLWEKAPLFALAALVALVTLHAQAVGGALTTFETLPFASRVANAFASLGAYLVKGVFPTHLALFYVSAVRRFADPAVLLGMAVVLVTSAVAFRSRLSVPWLAAGWLWYLVTLLPVIGLVQVGAQSMADRYTYLPLIGVFLAAVWGCAAAVTRQPRFAPAAPIAAGIALVACVLLTQRQVGFWRDGETLFAHAASITPGSWPALYNLGLARESRGDLEGAARSYRDVLQVEPGYATARFGLAIVLDRLGRSEEALVEMLGAARADPDDPVIGMQLALQLERAGRTNEAIGLLRALINRRPLTAEAYNNLAVLLARRGERGEAAALLGEALAINPDYVDARQNLEALLPSGNGVNGPSRMR